MYSNKTRLMASILLYSHILSSCFNPTIGLNKQKIQEIEAKADKPASTLAQPIQTAAQPNHNLNQGQIKSKEVILDPNPSDQLGKLSDLIVPKGAITAEYPFSRKATILPETQAKTKKPKQEPNKHLLNDQKSLQDSQLKSQGHRQTSLQAISKALINKTFQLKSGQEVSFHHRDGRLEATVHEQIGIFTRTLILPIHWQDFNLDQHIQAKHIEVILPEQAPDKQGYVSIGKRGLLGGMQANNNSIEAFRQECIEKKFKELLEAISIKAKDNAPSCFMSYAWHDKQGDGSFDTLDSRVHQVAQYLQLAGVKVLLDLKHNHVGTSIGEFVRLIDNVDYVLWMGSKMLKDKCSEENLAKAHKLEFEGKKPAETLPVVSREAVRIKARLKRTGKGFLLPGCLEAKHPEVFPAFVKDIASEPMMKWPNYKAVFQFIRIMCPNLVSLVDAQEDLLIAYQKQVDTMKQEEVEAIVADIEEDKAEEQKNFVTSLKTDMKVGYTKQEKLAEVGSLPKLHTYIALAKLKNYLTRQDKHEWIARQLTSKGICVVVGPGGAGKSTLASEYGYENQSKKTVYWMLAETPDKLISSYEKIAKELGIDREQLAKELQKESDRYLVELSKRVYALLESSKQEVLLILDNAVDPKLIEGCLLDKPNSVQVLITTRNKRDFNEYTPLELTSFSELEARKYIQEGLKLRITPLRESEIEALIKEVGLSPQSLSLAVGYLKDQRTISVQNYLDKLALLKQGVSKEHGKLILPEARLGLETLVGVLAKGQTLMHYGAYLDPDFIPMSLVRVILEVEDTEDLQEILDGLERLSLITLVSSPQAEELGIQIHREVQATCKSYQGFKDGFSEQTVLDILASVLEEEMPFLKEVSDKRAGEARLYAPHLAYVLNQAASVLRDCELLASLLDRMGKYHAFVSFSYGLCLDYYKQGLVVREKLYPSDDPKIAVSLENIGNAYLYLLGDYNQAKEYLQKALVIFEKHFGPDHPNTGITLTNLGNVYGDLGDYAKQKELLERALVIDEKHFGPDHPSTGSTLGNLANAYGSLGNYAKQKELLERALVIKEKHFGPEHPQTGITLTNLGIAYGDLGDYAKQKELLERALVIKEKHFGPDHPDTGITLNNLANAYGSLGDYVKQKELLSRALVIDEKHFGPDHTNTGSTLHNLGNAYGSLGDYEKQKELLERALVINEKHFGPDHPSTGRTLTNLGNAYGDLGDYEKQQELLERALVIKEKHFGPDHPETGITLWSLGIAYQNLENNQEALKYYQRAYDIFVLHKHPNASAVKEWIENLNSNNKNPISGKRSKKDCKIM